MPPKKRRRDEGDSDSDGFYPIASAVDGNKFWSNGEQGTDPLGVRGKGFDWSGMQLKKDHVNRYI